MGVIRDKLNWNAVKGFVRSRDAQKSIIIVLVVVLITWLFRWTFKTYCWNFLEVDTFLWFFSTLAQVFGTLLGLLGVTIVFVISTFSGLHEKLESLRDKHERVKGEVEGLREKSNDLEDKLECFDITSKALDELDEDLGVLRKMFIKISLFTIGLISVVVIYSIIILPLSHLLITKKAIAGAMILLFGIAIPIFVIFALIILIWALKRIVHLCIRFEEFSRVHKDFIKTAEDSYK